MDTPIQDVTPANGNASVTEPSSQNSTSQVANTQEVNGKIFAGGKSEGRKSEQAKWINAFRDGFGFETEGEITPQQVVEYVKSLQQPEPKKTNETEKQYQERLKTAQEQSKKFQEEAIAAKAQLESYLIREELSKSFNANEVTDSGDVISLFQNTFDIRKTNEGVHIYYKNGELVRDEQFNPATVQKAMADFLNKKPHLLKSRVTGTNSLKDLMGIPQGDHIKNLSDAEKLELATKMGIR